MSGMKRMVDALGRSVEERREWAAIVEEANKDAQQNWDNPKWRAEFAQELTESILLGFDFETLVDRFIDTERVGFDGRVFIREGRGLKAFWMARGGYIEASALTSEVSELPRDMIGVHVYEFEDKVETNFVDTVQNLRDLAITRMDSEVNRRVLTLLTEAIPSSSPYYVSTPGLSKPAVDMGIRHVRDATRTGQVAIVGRSTMTDQITDFDGFSNETKEEIRQRGVLGIYRGAQIITLNNYLDEEDQAYIPANELWIMAKDVGKFAFYGGLKSKEFTEQDNWYWHYLARRDSGVMIHHPERARRLLDSNQTA